MVLVRRHALHRRLFAAAGVAVAALALGGPDQAAQPGPHKRGLSQHSATDANANAKYTPPTIIYLTAANHQADTNNQKQPPFYEQPDIWVAGFTGLLFVTTFFLWLTTRQMVFDARRIGEAQVRAYVSITGASVTFIDMGRGDVEPLIEISARNSGQSPALNFVWRPTIQYMSASTNRRRALQAAWRTRLGTTIAVGSDHHDSVVVDDMPLNSHLAENGIGIDRVFVRVEIHFEYTDVFNRPVMDDVNFVGMFTRIAGGLDAPTPNGRTQWTGTMGKIDRPGDWDTAPQEDSSD